MLRAAERERQHDSVESHSADGDSQHKRPRAFKTARRAPGSRGSHHFSASGFWFFAAGFLMRPAIRLMKSLSSRARLPQAARILALMSTFRPSVRERPRPSP
jgi:hypothetical protein